MNTFGAPASNVALIKNPSDGMNIVAKGLGIRLERMSSSANRSTRTIRFPGAIWHAMASTFVSFPPMRNGVVSARALCR